jgi:hypothetical protein
MDETVSLWERVLGFRTTLKSPEYFDYGAGWTNHPFSEIGFR